MSGFEDFKDKPKKPKKQEDFKMQVDEKDKFDVLKEKYEKDKDKFEKDKYKTDKDKDKYKLDKDKYKTDKDKAKDKDKGDKDDKDKFKDKEKDGKDNKFKSKENKNKPDKDKDKKKEKGEKFNKGGKDKVIKVTKKRRKKPARSTWATYIHKVLKTVHDDECTLSSKAMQILDSFANDLFERISTEAVKLLRLNNKRTLTSMEIQTAARLVLPGELCKHAIQDGAKAVSKYQLAEP